MRPSLIVPLAAAISAALTPQMGAQRPASVTPVAARAAVASPGYYRFPAISGQTIVFTAEGDLWRAPITGGVAQRLTTAPAEEAHAAISPDGQTIAFSASYEGPTEVYTMPLAGGAPVRHTFDGSTATVVGWTPDGRIMYTTRKYSTLPNTEMAIVDPRTNAMHLVQLAQASDGAFTSSGTLFFTRFAFQGSYTKRYKGGTAQNIWKFAPNASEATPLTGDWKGTSRSPMLWRGRLYFNSDRDGTMNLWSMDENGQDLRQLTHHADFDVQSPALADGRIVYQLGADLHVFDIAANADRVVPITLVSDFDQTRERWVTNPAQWITGEHLSPTGDRVALTARGQVFVVPTDQGRLVDATATQPARWRDARFMPDGKSMLALSDKSGEMEFWTMPANGVGGVRQITRGGTVLRWQGVPSPDGKWLANTDKNQKLWVTDVATGQAKLLGTNGLGDFGDLTWSPDSRWLAYTAPATNQFGQIYLYSVETGASTPVTTDRYDSYSPAWSPDGKWMYFLSDRHLASSVQSTWGARQPEPYFDRQTEIFALALVPGERSQFQEADELHQERARQDSVRPDTVTKPGPGGIRQEGAPRAAISLDGIAQRLVHVPVPPDNYSSLTTDGKRLYFIKRDAAEGAKPDLETLAIGHEKPEIVTYLANVGSYELSENGKKLLVRRGTGGAAPSLLVLDAGAKAPTDLTKSQLDLKGWVLHFDPRAEWHEEFDDAWRLERDYFYDQGMNGVDWAAMRRHYEPLVDRVTDRAELSDILAQMVGELSALHIFVRGGDMRRGADAVLPASLGASLSRDEAHGGYRVDHVYATDPDEPESLAPLARYGVDVHDGDIITTVNGVPTLSVPDIGSLLRDQADKQVLLGVRPASGSEREVVVTPVSQQADAQLRYSEWEYTRRRMVEQQAKGEIGYVHLRAMGGNDINQWARDFYPSFNRAGLIIDVRHNNGGNIDSWILEKLLRKPWFYFQSRVGDPTWNMQYAFRGQIVVLTDESTASDGEAFSEGFRRLGLGKIIGTRTWGGEIWLSSSNILVDRGIATAAEMGVYGPESKWLIEGHGVDPDIVVDNLPHATFEGKDAQLEAAIAYLQQQIKAHPNPVPPHPAYPDKSLPAAVQAGSPRKP